MLIENITKACLQPDQYYNFSIRVKEISGPGCFHLIYQITEIMIYGEEGLRRGQSSKEFEDGI